MSVLDTFDQLVQEVFELTVKDELDLPTYEIVSADKEEEHEALEPEKGIVCLRKQGVMVKSLGANQ